MIENLEQDVTLLKTTNSNFVPFKVHTKEWVLRVYCSQPVYIACTLEIHVLKGCYLEPQLSG